MNTRRDHFLTRIRDERERQPALPGSEFDLRNSPNDWAAIALHYLSEEVRRGGRLPNRDRYEAAMVQAAAVILAALEHIDIMDGKGFFEAPDEE